jgi:hypothetical protein
VHKFGPVGSDIQGDVILPKIFIKFLEVSLNLSQAAQGEPFGVKPSPHAAHNKQL